MSLAPGTKLAHFEIVEPIGAGGRERSTKALDRKLEREVAPKILPAELAENDHRRERFQREAKVVAALNHPNIFHVYSVERADGIHFMTMELVKGKTLAEILPKKGFSFEKFLDIAIPLADAVAAAHEKGIVHRDLKPGNVMVSDSSTSPMCRVLFATGLAKHRRSTCRSAGPRLCPSPAPDSYMRRYRE